MPETTLNSFMVPLDGSQSGEQALMATLPLARAAHARLHLVHVHEDPRMDAMARSAVAYVESLAARVATDANVPVTSALLSDEIGGATFSHPPRGAIADILIRYARANDIDLISMSTHGRGGLSRAWLGSVADSVVRQSAVPVLLHRVGEGERTGATFKKILIPLDGSEHAERVIPPATAIGRLAGADYTLLLIAPFYPPIEAATSFGYATARAEELALQFERARAYLDSIADRMREDHLDVSVTLVESMDVPGAINKVAADGDFDLVAVATRGLGGGSRLLLGSVVDKVIRAAQRPVLICNSGHELGD